MKTYINRYTWPSEILAVRIYTEPHITLNLLGTKTPVSDTQVTQSKSGSAQLSIPGASFGPAIEKSYTAHAIRDFRQLHDTAGKPYHFEVHLNRSDRLPTDAGSIEFVFEFELQNSRLSNTSLQTDLRLQLGQMGKQWPRVLQLLRWPKILRLFRYPQKFQGVEASVKLRIEIPADSNPIRRALRKTRDDLKDHLQATIDDLDHEALQLRIKNLTDKTPLLPHLDIPQSTTPVPDSAVFFLNLSEALEHYPSRLILLGEPGSGKTTTIVRFALSVIEKRLRSHSAVLPIYVEIRDWLGETPILPWIIRRSNLPETALEDIRQGSALILADGLDEIGFTIGSEDNLQFKFLHTLEEELAGNIAVVTCRNADFKRMISAIESVDAKKRQALLLQKYGIIEVHPLSDDQISVYLGKADLVDIVFQDEQLRTILRNPLILRIFSVAYQSLPDEARSLAVVQGGDGELRDKIFTAYVRERCRHEALKDPVRFSNMDRLEAWINDIYTVLRTAKIYSLSTPGGFLTRKDLLAHSTIDRSFLAGIRIHKNKELNAFIEQLIEMHLVIRDGDDVRFIHALLEYHFTFEATVALLETEPELTWPSQYLGEIRDKRAVPALIRHLEKDRGMAFSVEALGAIGDPRAVPTLVRLLSQSNTPSLDIPKILIALGRIRSLEAVQPLLKFLKGSKNTGWIERDQVRACQWALVQIGRPAVESLIKELYLESEYMRSEVSYVLASIEDDRAIHPMIEVLRAQLSEQTRLPFPRFLLGYLDIKLNTHIVFNPGLGEIVEIRRDIYHLILNLTQFKQRALRPLRTMYETGVLVEKRAAIWSLANISDESLVQFFIELLDNEYDTFLRCYSIYGLASNYDKSRPNEAAISSMINAASRRPIAPIEFDCVLWSLGKLGDRRTVNLAVRYLDMKLSESARYHAIGGLGLSENRHIVPSIVPFLNDANMFVRQSTAEALGRLKDPRAVNHLINALPAESDAQVRSAIVDALGELGDQEAAQVILPFLESLPHQVIEALGKLRDKSVLLKIEGYIPSNADYMLVDIYSQTLAILRNLPD